MENIIIQRRDMIDEAYYLVVEDLKNFFSVWVDFYEDIKKVFPDNADYIDKCTYDNWLSYSIHKDMAIVLDKAMDYEKEIELCSVAISVGAFRDGTKGGMQARLEKARKKMDQSKLAAQDTKKIPRNQVVINPQNSRCPLNQIDNYNDRIKGIDEGYKYFEQGEEYLDKGEYEEAIDFYDKARAVGLNTYELYISYARAYRKMKDYENEIVILEEFIERNPSLHNREMSNRIDKAIKFLYNKQQSEKASKERKERNKKKQLEKRIAAENGQKVSFKRAVRQLDDEGNIINEFESIAEAKRVTGVSSRCIRDAADGFQRHAGGYVWEFV